MTILTLADVHGNVEMLRRVIASAGPVDLALLLGDITHFGGSEEAESVVGELAGNGISVLGVIGNCDYPDAGRYLDMAGVNLHGRSRVLEGMVFVGAGGSLPCIDATPNEIADSEFRTILDGAYSSIAPGCAFVLVTHQPPLNTPLDVAGRIGHVGSAAVREFIEKYRPVAAFCGHIHESLGTCAAGATRLMNPGSVKHGLFGIVEIEGHSVSRMEMRRL